MLLTAETAARSMAPKPHILAKEASVGGHGPGKYACLELERRFLLSGPPAGLIERGDFRRITDRYLPGTRLRLRRVETPEGQCLERKLAQKSSHAAAPTHATITNIYLSADEYRCLQRLEGAAIVKMRHVLDHQGRPLGIDVFAGRHHGLILAEAEFESEVQMRRLSVPRFAVREVTDDPFFTGSRLAFMDGDEFRRGLDRRLHHPE